MFGPEFFIDSFQSTKKIITNQIFKDATLNKAATDYIDAQTAFAKMLTRNAIDLTKYSVELVSEKVFPKKEEKVAKAEATKTSKAKAKDVEANTDINTQGD